jgi:hypothetical protein
MITWQFVVHTLQTAALVVLVAVESRGDGAATPFADALDWYSLWSSESSNTQSVQNCRGERRGELYRFRCDPLAVVVTGVIDDNGRCSIRSMTEGLNIPDDVRVPRLDHIVPPRRIDPEELRDCGELPANEGGFEMSIAPRARRVNSDLTRDARAALLRHIMEGGYGGCVFLLPNVRTGDPFFHAYEQCADGLVAVFEFTIQRGKVVDFPHWTYTRRRGHFPAGWSWRMARPDFWSGMSRPEERNRESR